MKGTNPIGLTAACLVLPLLASTGCDDSTEQLLAPGDIAVQANHGQHEPGFWSQLAQLRRATARYHRLSVAMDDGYDIQATVCWFYTGQGGMGYHYVDGDLVDGTVELLKPELLLYEPQRNGRMRLVAMEYIVPIAAWTGDGRPSLLGQEFHDNGAGLYILHIWLWKYNPSGLFADWNPRATCRWAAESDDQAP